MRNTLEGIRPGINLRAKLAAPRKATHLIEDYNATARTIVCDCGWHGMEAEFQPHRKSLGAQKKQRLAAAKLLDDIALDVN